MAKIDLEKLSKKINTTLEETARGVKLDLFNGVIRYTRVKTGRLRGNWQTTTGKTASGKLERKDKIPQGVDGGKAQEEVQANIQPFTTDYLTNNLPYAAKWEEEDGMIRKNLERVERNIRRRIKK